jgi:hypothetical protein
MGPKALKGIAYGLLSTFVSRNNDIDGYWGLGVLRLFAETHGMRMIALDLLGPEPTLSVGSPVQIAERIYHKWLVTTLERSRIDRSIVAHANISIRFTTFEEFPKVVRDTRGEPYECTVTIVRADGRQYSARKVGVCAPHDPRKDHRSRILKQA